MTIDLTQVVPVLIGLGTIFTTIYAFSSKVAAINSKLEMHEYKINGCYESLNHKASRLLDEINSLERKFEEFIKQNNG